MLETDPPGAGAFEIADLLLERRRDLQRVVAQHVEQALRLGFEAGGGDLASVLDGLLREHHRPDQQRGALALLDSGLAMPFLIDSRMPGTDNRCSVSWMVCQSSADSSTALLRLPAMRMGWCDSAVWSISR